MSTFFNFVPPTNSAFSFQPDLDGQSYIATVPWSLFGQRWMLNLQTTDGVLIFSKALVGSPAGFNAQSVTWDHGRIRIVTATKHSYDVLNTVNLSLINFAPTVLNGRYQCFIDGTSSFSFAFSNNPGNVTHLGQVNYDINLVAGYFATSTLVFRESNQQFEVTP